MNPREKITETAVELSLLLALLSVSVVGSAAEKSTNPIAVASPSGASATESSNKTTNAVSFTQETNAVVEKEYEQVLSQDDEAQADVDKWIRDNNQFRAQGAGVPDAELNRRILERFEPVRKAYDEFIRKYPDHAKARLAYGGFLNDSKDETGAKVQWEKALELDPANPAAYNNLAGSYAESGDEKKAFEYFAKAIELKPSEPIYYHNFGDALYVLRKKAMEVYRINEQQVYVKALLLYSNAFRLDPKNLPFASKVADTYYAIKPFPPDAALKAWSNALEVAQTDVEREGVYIHLARVKMLADKFAEARAQLKAVTNHAYAEIKTELLKNIEQRENPGAATNSPVPTVEKKAEKP